MNRGLLEKAARETWLLTLVLGLALAAAEGLLAYVLPTFRKEIAGVWAQIELVQNLIRALLGTEVGDAVGPQAFQALPWVHPIVLAIVWTHQLVLCTRMPAGEIDRGTIDVLLGLPISRWQAFIAETAVFLLSGIVLFAAGTGGNYTGCLLANADSFPSAENLAAILANGYCLYLAVGGITYFAASLANRRGRAVGWSLAAVLASFLLTFLAQFWQPARSIAFLSLLHYYRPMRIFIEGWPLTDMAVLSAIGAVSWTLGGLIFACRDIRTV